MKWFIFKLVAVFSALLAAPMFIKGPDGQPIMSPSDWVPDNAWEKLVDLASGVVDGVERSVESVGAAGTGSPPPG
ncbi:MAG: hypothetical protein HKO07_00125, partial [Pseudomonadales bacterium]|nr:hypothetical protein [Pseudomonadales bacterium]